jgi:hypothetical protein
VIVKFGCLQMERVRVRILLQALFTLQTRIYFATGPEPGDRRGGIAVRCAAWEYLPFVPSDLPTRQLFCSAEI